MGFNDFNVNHLESINNHLEMEALMILNVSHLEMDLL